MAPGPPSVGTDSCRRERSDGGVIADVSSQATFSSTSSITIDMNECHDWWACRSKHHTRAENIGDTGRLRCDVLKVEALASPFED
jgi:hypothetical protein